MTLAAAGTRLVMRAKLKKCALTEEFSANFAFSEFAGDKTHRELKAEFRASRVVRALRGFGTLTLGLSG